MNERIGALLGLVGLLLGYVCVATSIALSPWFEWERNAISDLGHAVRSEVAPILNFGLLLTGLLLMFYTVTAVRRHARWTSYSLAVSAFSLQLVAAFDEVYVFIHTAVSIAFFVSLGIASILYAVERRSYLGATSFIIVLVTWMLYWTGAYSSGLAVPEIISSIAVSFWIAHSAIKVYVGQTDMSR